MEFQSSSCHPSLHTHLDFQANFLSFWGLRRTKLGLVNPRTDLSLGSIHVVVLL